MPGHLIKLERDIYVFSTENIMILYVHKIGKICCALQLMWWSVIIRLAETNFLKIKTNWEFKPKVFIFTNLKWIQILIYVYVTKKRLDNLILSFLWVNWDGYNIIYTRTLQYHSTDNCFILDFSRPTFFFRWSCASNIRILWTVIVWINNLKIAGKWKRMHARKAREGVQ